MNWELGKRRGSENPQLARLGFFRVVPVFSVECFPVHGGPKPTLSPKSWGPLNLRLPRHLG